MSQNNSNDKAAMMPFIEKINQIGLLPALKLGSFKVRKVALEKFLQENEGYDLTDGIMFINQTEG